MIQPQELRMGNIVYNRHNDPIEVDWKDLHNMCQPRMDGHGYTGIPLTPEWLERMGFIHNPIVLLSRQYLIKLGRDRMLSVSDAGTPNEILFIQEVDGEKVTDLVCIHNFDYDGKLHVHQLQNLYHTITGNELEVKP